MSNAPFVKFLKPGSPEVIDVPKNQHLFLSNACLSSPFEDLSKTTTLTMDITLEQGMATIDGVALCILSPGGSPHASILVPLQRGRKYTLKVDGPNTICLYGYYGSQASRKMDTDSASFIVKDKNRNMDSTSIAGVAGGSKRKVEEVSEAEDDETTKRDAKKKKKAEKRQYVGATP
ncbi:hypothetical protein VKT23_015920 [Stygiomarasmius scandens]|uniref:Nucleoplasmin-like domain-containing protein n=1 Tax=Marasmiellus scandens TaxID=2682957 RepID=A0ABR1IZQ7_9AGAR